MISCHAWTAGKARIVFTRVRDFLDGHEVVQHDRVNEVHEVRGSLLRKAAYHIKYFLRKKVKNEHISY